MKLQHKVQISIARKDGSQKKAIQRKHKSALPFEQIPLFEFA